jgi:hypothetical protein
MPSGRQPFSCFQRALPLVLAAALGACGGGGDDGGNPNPTVTGKSGSTDTPVVRYNLGLGDTLAAKNGWAFASPGWTLAAAEDGSMALPFEYTGTVPGNYGMSEMRFTMPPQDQFWLHLRWHIPTNYAHRHDTRIDVTGAQTAGWQIGDHVRGTDGVSEGVITVVDSTGIFLRFATKSAYDSVWIGSITNTTRGVVANSTGRSQWGANNKLLAIWTDDYSAAGKGSTIVWQTDLTWSGDGGRDSIITVAHSTGGNTVSGVPAHGGVLITSADYGKAMDIIFYGKFSSAPGARNGVIRTFVRKQGQTAYTMYHNITNADMDKRTDVAANLRQWRAGYLMGWSNSGFDANTKFYISKIEAFDQMPNDLVGVSP